MNKDDLIAWSGFDTVGAEVTEYPVGSCCAYGGRFSVEVFFQTREDAEAFANAMHTRGYDPTITTAEERLRNAVMEKPHA